MESLKTSYKTCLLEFITDLKKTFPDSKEVSNCERVKEKINHEKHIKYLQVQVKPFKEKFIAKDTSIFDSSEVFFIPTVDFAKLMNNTSSTNQKAMWKYLHTLYLLGQQVSSFENNSELDTEELSKIVDNLQEKVEKGSSSPNFSIDELLGGSGGAVNNKMNDLVKNLASSLSSGGQNPMAALQNPDGFKNLFNQVKTQVEDLCENEQFQEKDLENYAESIKGNLQNKLNIPLDDLMKNIQTMMGGKGGGL